MVTSAQVTPQAFVEAMRPQTEEMLRQVMAAVNAAPVSGGTSVGNIASSAATSCGRS